MSDWFTARWHGGYVRVIQIIRQVSKLTFFPRYTVTLSSPVNPWSFLIPPCPSFFCPFPLCLILTTSLRPAPPPASGLYVCCPPAAHDLSSAGAASSSLSASPGAFRGHHRRERCAPIPAGRGFSAAPVSPQGKLVLVNNNIHTYKTCPPLF